MTALLYSVGRFCARRHRLVLAAWALLVLALALAGRAAGDRTSDNLRLPGTGSTAASDLLEQRLPDQAYGSNPLVVRAPDGTVSGAALDDTAAALRSTPHVVGVGSPRTSEDRTIAYLPVALDVGPGDISEEDAQAVLDAGAPARAAGLDVSLGGYAGQQLSKPDTHTSEAIGLAAAVVILLFAFGTATAMALPIVTSVLCLVAALAVIRLLGLLTDVPTIAPTLATMIGLGVGIDYALFIVTRHKQQLRDGVELRESIARATATAGGAVVFAGTTVVIALASLLFAGIPLVTKLGYTAAIAVLVSVAGAITLLPALLGALGPRIEALRVRRGEQGEPHGWTRWARGVARRPWRSLAASTAVLVVLALPVLDLHLGQSDVGALPASTTARQAYDAIEAGFGAGANGPLLVAAELGEPARPDDPRLAQLSQAIASAPHVQSVSPPTLDERGTTAVLTVVSDSAPSSAETEELVHHLRSTTLPAATAGTDLVAHVGGQTAGYIDLAARIADKLPAMIAIVVALSFAVLLLAFRSLVVPAKAALMNLLSVGAAYGVVTAIFQEGWGAGLVGLEHSIPIVSFVPLLMFAILFGLSMDYEVFLLTHVQERYRSSRRPTHAVIEGLAGTGRVITSAALIMVCVFVSFVLSGDPVVKQFGVGLAVAIAIDATLVRCLLVPATMTLLGRASWWMPAWIGRRLPRISVEGSISATEGGK